MPAPRAERGVAYYTAASLGSLLAGALAAVAAHAAWARLVSPASARYAFAAAFGLAGCLAWTRLVERRAWSRRAALETVLLAGVLAAVSWAFDR